jgi:phosphate transport system permease protein
MRGGSDTLADPASPLTATGNLRRREVVSRLAEGSSVAAAMLAVAVLCLVVYGVASRGVGALNLDFFTKSLPVGGSAPGGGVLPAFVGSAMIVGAAAVIAVPAAVLTALYVSEFAGPRQAGLIRLALDIMNGIPTIVIGLFLYGLIVHAEHHQSGFAGSIALSIVMVPLIARSTQEVLGLVPHAMREAADALGVSRWRTVVGVVLPAAAGGIITGTILAVARAAGETAPLLILSSNSGFPRVITNFFGQAIPNVPILIFTLSEEPTPLGLQRAWGAAFVLLVVILLANIGARALFARSRAKMGS